MRVAVIGCGYVGLATSTVLADLGHQVAGVEIDREKLGKLAGGQAPIYEAHLQDLLTANISAGRLAFSDDHTASCCDADIIIIAVGTPTRETWEIDLGQLESAVDSIAESLEARDESLDPPVVVTKSTVPSGTSDYLRERLTTRTDRPFRIASNPEFLREGQAILDTFYPDRIVVGAEVEDGNRYIKGPATGFVLVAAGADAEKLLAVVQPPSSPLPRGGTPDTAREAVDFSGPDS